MGKKNAWVAQGRYRTIGTAHPLRRPPAFSSTRYGPLDKPDASNPPAYLPAPIIDILTACPRELTSDSSAGPFSGASRRTAIRGPAEWTGLTGLTGWEKTMRKKARS
jgi:hypothetical protein